MMKKKITYLVLVLSTCLLVGCGAVSETEESENFSTVEETAEMAEGTEGIPEGSGEMSRREKTRKRRLIRFRKRNWL